MFNISGEALMSKCLSISPPPQDKLVKESEKPSTNQGFASGGEGESGVNVGILMV